MDTEYAFSVLRRITLAEYEVLEPTLHTEKSVRQRQRAQVVANEIVQGSYKLIPREYRKHFERKELDIAIDATLVESPARKTIYLDDESPDYPFLYENLPCVSTDANAGRYTRDGNQDGDVDSSRGARYDSHREIRKFGREAHTVINYQNEIIPRLVLAFSFDKPGKRIAANAMYGVDTLLRRGFTPGHLVADRAYLPGCKADEFQIPLRAKGFKLVFDYPKNMRGQQGGFKGFILVDGQFYSSGMPQNLIDASYNYWSVPKGSDKYLSTEEYQGLLARREQYRVKSKASADKDGYKRVSCPARGPYASVSCPLVEPHRDALNRAKARAFPQQVEDLNLLGKGCMQSSVTIPPWVGAKHAQEYPYMSEQWHAHYGLGRAHVENQNMRLKMSHAAALHDPGRRPARGFFAQILYTAILIAATNCNAIYKWMREKLLQRAKGVSAKSRKGRRLIVGAYSNAKVQPEITDPPPEVEMPQAS